jgi:DNA-binding NarL/FixJ family response regulator
MIKILIADDHAIVREGLKQIVATEKGLIVNGEAGEASELFAQLEQKSFDIVVLDINMPGISGLDILKDMNTRFPNIPVLILSMYSEEQYGIRAIKAGASGYLKKVSAPEELVNAIKKIVGGGKYISPALAESLVKTISIKSSKPAHENLSNREFEIMCKIAEGKSAEDIAKELSISVHTFYSYRNRIFEKMNLKSNVEITQYVLQNKLGD